MHHPATRDLKSYFGLSLSVFCIVFAADGILTQLLGLRFNWSPSEPIGIYRLTSDPNAPYVQVRPPVEATLMALDRGYTGGLTEFVKTSVGKPGDVIQYNEEGISLNGVKLQNTAPLTVDSKGRPLAHFPFGTYLVTSDVWVLSTYNKKSFDSRYFGPLATRYIENRLTPLWTF